MGWLAGCTRSALAHWIRNGTAAPRIHPDLGGLFRDCVIHDIDTIRFVTIREVVEVIAVGGRA